MDQDHHRITISLRRRPPDFIIGGKENPYLLRWYLVRSPWFEVMLHKILRDDDDRALHDHPFDNVSIILRGTYREHRKTCSPICWHPKCRPTEYSRGDVIRRQAEVAHRLVVVRGPVWTIFITGRRRREWGFHCPQGWRPWREFVDERDRGMPGKGCA